MKFTDAEKLLRTYVHGDTLLRHCLTVAVALDWWARDYGEADSEYWRSVGLLHDIDFEQFPDQHCIKARDILEAEKANFPDLDEGTIHAVQSHGWGLCCDVEPTATMEKVLYTVDELTGLIFACAMARPSKSVMDMEVKSVTKKFKTPNFAAGCTRAVIQKGADLMGVDLNTVIEKTIAAMRSEHEAIGV
jgi:putative nucleotidyltransferase with HDIG domain